MGGEENCQRYQKSILKKLCELKVLMLKNVLSGCLPPLPDLILEYIANCFIEDEEASTSLCSHLSYNNEEGRLLHKNLFQVLCDVYNEWRIVSFNLNDGIYLTGLPSASKVDSLGEVVKSYRMYVSSLVDV